MKYKLRTLLIGEQDLISCFYRHLKDDSIENIQRDPAGYTKFSVFIDDDTKLTFYHSSQITPSISSRKLNSKLKIIDSCKYQDFLEVKKMFKKRSTNSSNISMIINIVDPKRNREFSYDEVSSLSINFKVFYVELDLQSRSSSYEALKIFVQANNNNLKLINKGSKCTPSKLNSEKSDLFDFSDLE